MPEFDPEELGEVRPVCERWPTCEGYADREGRWLQDSYCIWPSCAEPVHRLY